MPVMHHTGDNTYFFYDFVNNFLGIDLTSYNFLFKLKGTHAGPLFCRQYPTRKCSEKRQRKQDAAYKNKRLSPIDFLIISL